MQLVLLFFSSLVFVSCASTNNTKLEALGMLSDSPKAYSKKLAIKNKKEYKKAKIEDRCFNQGGPQEYKTLLNVELEDVSEFDVWTNKNNDLLERVVIPVDAEPAVLSFKQEGCEHHGVIYELELPNEFNMDDPNQLINFAVQFFEEWQANKLFSDDVLFETLSENFRQQVDTDNEEEAFRINLEKCSLRSSTLNCKFEEEPNELTLKMFNSNSKAKMQLRYWFSL